MSWLFSSKKPSFTPTNLQTQKTKQIESLNRLSAIVIEVLRDVEYRVTFPVDTVTYTLIIHLPPTFPQAKPNVSVEPLLRHPWVDNQMVVSLCPALLGFSMHSSLGGAIQTIIDSFRATQPQPLGPGVSMQTHAPVTQPPLYSQTQTYKPPTTLSTLPAPYIHPTPSMPLPTSSQSQPAISSRSLTAQMERIPFFYTMPSLPMSFPQLSDKSAAELNTFLNDEDKLQELVDSLPEIKKIADDKQNVSKRITDLAKGNLSIKPTIDVLKDELHQKITRLGGLQSGLDRDRVAYTEHTQQYAPSNIITNLKVAILTAEEDSEKIADTFLERKMLIDEFCKDFLPKRALCHSRRAKEEKLQQIMASQVAPKLRAICDDMAIRRLQSTL